jgi:very-long-chain ceramide synthase
VSPLLKWAIDPLYALRVLLVPIILYTLCQSLGPALWPGKTISNPFAPFFLLSHHVPTSSTDDPRYQKGYLDLVFIAYYVVFWSLVRQIVVVNISGRIARRVGIRREERIARFGEQVYAIFYWGIMGAWGWVRSTFSSASSYYTSFSYTFTLDRES